MRDINIEGDFVHQCIEEIGFGKFQILALAIMFKKISATSFQEAYAVIVNPL